MSGLVLRFHPPEGLDGTRLVEQPDHARPPPAWPRSGEGGGVRFDVAGTLAHRDRWPRRRRATVTGINANVAIADEEGNVPDPASPDVPDLAPSTSTSTTAPPPETTEG